MVTYQRVPAKEKILLLKVSNEYKDLMSVRDWIIQRQGWIYNVLGTRERNLH